MALTLRTHVRYSLFSVELHCLQLAHLFTSTSLHNDLCAEGAKPPSPGVDQTTIPQKIRLNEKCVLSEATSLQKRACKKLFTVKVEKSRNFYKCQFLFKI